jgi:hypothetical protein
MLHELVLALLGHTGDVFEPETFKISAGFPHLHISERTILDRLAQLGRSYTKFQQFTQMQTKSQFIAALQGEIDLWLEEYRSAVVSLEETIMKEKITLPLVQLSLEGVRNDYSKS